MSLESAQTSALFEEPVSVLVVDHGEEDREALRGILNLPDLRVVEAASAKEALLRLLEEDYALLFIAVVMPEMSGLELAKLIRERPRTARVPIVFMTGVATERASMLEGYALGGVDYLLKPLVPDIVRAKVEVFADLQRARKKLERQAQALLEAQRRQSEIELLELRLATARRYRGLADAIPHIVVMAKPDGAAEYFNRRYFEFTGISRADAVEDWMSILHPEEAESIQAELNAAVAREEPYEAECRIRRGSDGAYLWHLFRAVPEYGPMGELVSWIGTFTDIDEERRARASLTEFRATLDAVHDAVLIFDPRSMKLLYANQGASLLWERSVAGLLATDFEGLIVNTEAFREKLDSLIREEPGSTTLDIRCRREGGGTVPAELLLQYIPTGAWEGRAIAIARDTSERERAEAERELLYRNALEAVRARDEFLSIASHELKSPLTALSLQLHAMIRPGASELVLPEPTGKKLRFAARQTERLTKLLNELFDVSRIHAGRLSLDLEEMDLSALVRDVAARFADSAAHVHSELVVKAKEPCVGRWDRMRLEQVVVNLLSNAIKFGSGQPIELRVEVVEHGTVARFSVRDRGIGIAPEDIERIFSRFERAVPSRSHAGLGLGLYIVRQIVVAHGGTVRVASKPGEGAEFYVELPISGPPASDLDAEPTSEPLSKG